MYVAINVVDLFGVLMLADLISDMRTKEVPINGLDGDRAADIHH